MPAQLSHKVLSFKGQDLANEDFSGSDIHGFNFADAILKGANFSKAKAGIAPRWKIGLLLSSIFSALLAGFIMGYTSAFPMFIKSLLTEENTLGIQLVSLVASAILIALFVLTLRKGLGAALGFFALIAAAMVAIVSAIGSGDILAGILVQAMAIVGAFAGMILGTIVIATSVFIDSPKNLILGSIAVGTIPGIWEGLQGLAPSTMTGVWMITSLTTLALVALSVYVGRQVATGNPKYALIRAIALTLSTLGSTSFRGADLTGANFTQAHLPNTDLRNAMLHHSQWFQATGLDRARLDNTPLADSIVCQLLISRNGQQQNFDYYDLRHLNLDYANLQDASFIGADLSNSSLNQADLTGAKLARAKLHQASLNAANLTGTVIEDWGISTDTQLDNIICDFIYTRLPTADDLDPCRKPDNKNETFQLGDFTDFIAPFLKTLSLYKSQNVDLRQIGHQFRTLDLFHYETINPPAVALALQQIGQTYPEAELEVLLLEGRRNEKVRLQTRVATGINREKLSAEYFAAYEQLRPLPDRALLSRIDDNLQNFVHLLTHSTPQHVVYIEVNTYIQGDQHNVQGNQHMSQSQGNVSINTSGGNVQGVATASSTGDLTLTGVALGDIHGEVTIAINQLSEDTTNETFSLKALLTQLQTLIEVETELNNEDKLEALEQVKMIANAGAKPDDSKLQRAANTALKILRGTIATLPEATKLVQGCTELLPEITKFLNAT